MIRIYETFTTKEAAEAFRDRYYQSYHPQGYGTHIAIKEYEVDGEKRWLASGSRGASCD